MDLPSSWPPLWWALLMPGLPSQDRALMPQLLWVLAANSSQLPPLLQRTYLQQNRNRNCPFIPFSNTPSELMTDWQGVIRDHLPLLKLGSTLWYNHVSELLVRSDCSCFPTETELLLRPCPCPFLPPHTLVQGDPNPRLSSPPSEPNLRHCTRYRSTTLRYTTYKVQILGWYALLFITPSPIIMWLQKQT